MTVSSSSQPRAGTPARALEPGGRPLPATPLGAGRPLRRRTPPPGRPLVVNVLAALAGIGLALTLALGISAESAGSLQAPGGVATAAGRLRGLAAAYAMVVVVVLVARFGPLERAIGQDRLIRWHRRLGPWPLYLLVLHGSLITVGYAQAANDGVLHQFGQLLWTYPGVLAATVGGVLLIAAGVTPYRLAWRRMAFETWWSVHLALSFGAVLALPQVILEAYPPGVALFFFSVVASSVFAFVVIAGAYLGVAGRPHPLSQPRYRRACAHLPKRPAHGFVPRFAVVDSRHR